MMKKLSIITINYNDAPGLRKTIESVINQSFRDFEYIVIDGNSSDGSKDVLDEYRNSIDMAISEQDSGIYNAMNKGASFATGEYLLFLNSGDNLHNNDALRNLFELNPTADIVSSITLNYGENVSLLKHPPHIISLYTFVYGSLPHPSSIIKKDIFFKTGGYIEDYKIISDKCFFIDALLTNHASYDYTDIILTDFNRNGISTNNGHLEDEKMRLFFKDRFGYIMNDYGNPRDETIFNVAYWIKQQKGVRKKLLIAPLRLVNRILKLRNKLGKVIGLKKSNS